MPSRRSSTVGSGETWEYGETRVRQDIAAVFDGLIRGDSNEARNNLQTWIAAVFDGLIRGDYQLPLLLQRQRRSRRSSTVGSGETSNSYFLDGEAHIAAVFDGLIRGDVVLSMLAILFGIAAVFDGLIRGDPILHRYEFSNLIAAVFDGLIRGD